ncbi:MAG: RNA polymerase sigma factor [Chloroflexota bacterium]
MNQDKKTLTNLSSSTPDATLVQLAVNGNQEAFNHLYERYFTQVYNRVSYLIPTEDIDDVTQEVLIAMLQSLKSFRGDAKFGTWLRVITNRHIANYYRKNKNSLNDGPLDAESYRLKSPQNISESGLNRVFIQRGLSALPDHYREILLLRFAEGLKFQEIANVQEKSLDATKSLFRRAISALRDQLGGQYA